MGAPGRPEKKSERKAEAARRNARLPRPGARKVPLDAERIVNETLDRLRALGPRCVEFMEQIMADPRAPVMAKAMISREVLDRGGWPRLTETSVAVTAAMARPKLFELAGGDPLAAPTGWSDAPPPARAPAAAPVDVVPGVALPRGQGKVHLNAVTPLSAAGGPEASDGVPSPTGASGAASDEADRVARDKRLWRDILAATADEPPKWHE